MLFGGFWLFKRHKTLFKVYTVCSKERDKLILFGHLVIRMAVS